MSVQFVLSALVLSRLLLCFVMATAAGACFFYGAWRTLENTSENREMTSQHVTASYPKRRQSASWRDRIMAQAGWILLALSFALRSLGSLLFAYAEHLPKAFFAFVLVAAPVFVAAGLFLLLSPQDAARELTVKENEYSKAQAAKEATSGLFSLRGSLLAHFLSGLSGRARTLGLMAFDSLLLGSSMAALSWWLWTEPHIDALRTAPVETMGGAHSLATVLWFSSVAWIALNRPALRRARLQVGRFQGSFQRFVDAEPEDASNDAEVQKRWRQAALQPIWFTLLSGTSLFGWASVRAGSGVELAANEILLLLCGSFGFAAAAWLTNTFDAAPHRAAAHHDVPQAREAASLSGFVLRFFLRRFCREEEKRNNTLSSTQTSTRKQQKTRKNLKNAQFAANEGATDQDAADAAAISPIGAVGKEPQVRHAVFQVARNFLTLLLPCAAAAAGTWHVAPWKSSAPSIGAMSVAPEIWISETLVSFASLRYLLLSLHQNLYVWRTSQRLRISVETLREEVSWRTQQLTTLHSVSADLNNTLNNEQVLNIALQRLMEAVRAEAGAVWLVANFDQVAAEQTNQTRSFGNWNAELRRHRNPRDTSAASSTRTSFMTRLNMADACDSVQANSAHQNGVGSGATNGGATIGADPYEGAPDTLRDNARHSRLFPSNHPSTHVASPKGTSASGTSTNGTSPNGRNPGNCSKASPKQTKGKMGGLELLSGKMEGNGLYIGGPVKSWNTPMSGTGEIDGNGVLHRVSHTRDTYGAPPDKALHNNSQAGHSNGNQANGSASPATNAAPKRASGTTRLPHITTGVWYAPPDTIRRRPTARWKR